LGLAYQVRTAENAPSSRTAALKKGKFVTTVTQRADWAR
jgi:hypothetical protein